MIFFSITGPSARPHPCHYVYETFHYVYDILHPCASSNVVCPAAVAAGSGTAPRAARRGSLCLMAVPSVTSFLYLAGLAVTAIALLLISRRCGSPPPVQRCARWGCDRPVLDDEAGDWPSPRPELTAEAPDAMSRWRKLHLQHVTEAEQRGGSARVVFLGDSITEGWLRTGLSARQLSVSQPECEAIWTEAFGDWHPLNFGIGGDRVQVPTPHRWPNVYSGQPVPPPPPVDSLPTPCTVPRGGVGGVGMTPGCVAVWGVIC